MGEILEVGTEIKIGHLLAGIGRLHACRTDQVMDRIGLYRGQAILLMVLSKKDGLTHSEISEKLGISPAAATKVIKRMESMNYLQRRSDPTDERISRVYLEQEGRAVIQQVRHVFEQVDQVLLNNLSPEEQADLIRMLLQVHANLLEWPADASG